MTQEERNTLEETIRYGYNGYLGFKVRYLGEEGKCELEVDVTDNILNPMHVVHGGLIFSIGDTVGGLALRATGRVAGCTTCTSTIDYMNSATAGCKKIVGKAMVLKQGRRMSTVEIKIYDDSDKLIAQMLARYFHLDADFKCV